MIRPTASVGTAWLATFVNNRLLFDLYIFAWNFKVIAMQRDILTTWVLQDNDRNTLPDWQLIERAFSALPQSAPLWQYFVDVHVFYWVDDPKEDNRGAFKCQFIEKVLQRREECSNASPYQPDPCKYHEHETRDEASGCQVSRLVKEEARSRQRAEFEHSLGTQNPKLAEVLENESDSDDDDDTTEPLLKRQKREGEESVSHNSNISVNITEKREESGKQLQLQAKLRLFRKAQLLYDPQLPYKTQLLFRSQFLLRPSSLHQSPRLVSQQFWLK
jgi:hypothetical protein